MCKKIIRIITTLGTVIFSVSAALSAPVTFTPRATTKQLIAKPPSPPVMTPVTPQTAPPAPVQMTTRQLSSTGTIFYAGFAVTTPGVIQADLAPSQAPGNLLAPVDVYFKNEITGQTSAQLRLPMTGGRLTYNVTAADLKGGAVVYSLIVNSSNNISYKINLAFPKTDEARLDSYLMSLPQQNRTALQNALAQPRTAPTPPAASARPQPFTWTPSVKIREFYKNEDAPPNPEGCLDSSKWTTINNEAIIQYDWDIDGILDDGVRYKIATSGPKKCLILSNGTYAVTLKATTQRGASLSTTQSVVVKDFLLGGIGDSFSSGESMPDQAINYINWGITDPLWADSVDTTPNFDWKTDYYALVGPKVLHWPNHTKHSRCHRSSKAATPLVARKIAESYPYISATMMFFSCSGAEAETGLLNGYGGIEAPQTVNVKLAPNDCKYEITNDHTTEETRPLLWPQIDDLNAHMQPSRRKVDALTVSIGGNDIGFSTAVKALTTDTHGQNDTKLSRMITCGLNGLDSKYQRIKQKIDSLPAYYRTNIFVTEYPDVLTITRKDNGQKNWPERTMKDTFTDNVFWGSLGAVALATGGMPAILAGAGYLNNGLGGSFTFDGIHEDEAKWAYGSVLQPLNNKLKDIVSSSAIRSYGANRNNWYFVDGIQSAFHGHGYCSHEDINCNYSESWFRSATDSVHLQGPPTTLPGGTISISGKECLPCKANTKGIIHPKEAGHQKIADLMFNKITSTIFSDVTITLEGSPQVSPNTDAVYNLSVINNGHTLANEVRAALILPPGFAVKKCTDLTGACEPGQGNTTVKFDSLQVGVRRTFSFIVTAPNQSGICDLTTPYTIKAVVSTLNPDTAPANNLALATTAVVSKGTNISACNQLHNAAGNAGQVPVGTSRIPK